MTAADEVAGRIAADIFSGALHPGSELAERDLVTRYGVSRTPVREALKRLSERGLLQAGRRRVAVVKSPSEKELRDLYELRLKLEADAARLTARGITPEEIARLREINREFGAALRARDLTRMLAVRAEFHAVLVHATRNRPLADVLVMLRDRAYVVRHAHWQDPKRAAANLGTHRSIIAALAAGDGARYAKLALAQIRAGFDTYLRRLRPGSRNH